MTKTSMWMWLFSIITVGRKEGWALLRRQCSSGWFWPRHQVSPDLYPFFCRWHLWPLSFLNQKTQSPQLFLVWPCWPYSHVPLVPVYSLLTFRTSHCDFDDLDTCPLLIHLHPSLPDRPSRNALQTTSPSCLITCSGYQVVSEQIPIFTAWWSVSSTILL